MHIQVWEALLWKPHKLSHGQNGNFLCSQDEKRKWKLKKKIFFFIFKLLFKNPEKKKWLERGKKSVSREIYCPLYLGIYFNLLAISHYIMSLWGQNHGLLLFLCGEGTLCYVFNQICWINEWIQLTSLPSLTFLVKRGRGQINKNT